MVILDEVDKEKIWIEDGKNQLNLFIQLSIILNYYLKKCNSKGQYRFFAIFTVIVWQKIALCMGDLSDIIHN